MHAPMRLVTLDLDGTLIARTVFEAVAAHFGFKKEVDEWDRQFVAGTMSLEECFRLEFAKIAGAKVSEVHEALARADWLEGIREGVADLRTAGLAVAVLTDQPRFACEYLARFGLTEYFCSEAEVKDGVVTGRVDARFDKWQNLRTAIRGRFEPAEVCHVGNGPNDVAVFERVGWSVAMNATSDEVADGATTALWGVEDLRTAAEQVLELREAA